MTDLEVLKALRDKFKRELKGEEVDCPLCEEMKGCENCNKRFGKHLGFDVKHDEYPCFAVKFEGVTFEDALEGCGYNLDGTAKNTPRFEKFCRDFLRWVNKEIAKREN